MDGIDVVFHHAAIRITQCAEEPRLALEVLVDGTYNVFEAAAEAEVRKVDRVLIGLRLRAGGDVPHPRGPPPVRQRHALRRRQGVQRGAAAQHPRHVRARLRRAALLQRLRPAHGRARPLHRGARPLDGADRGRPAAADPRRRPADDGLRLHRRHRHAQTCSPPQSDLTDVVFNVASGSETSLLELAQMLLRVMGSDLPVEHGPARAVNGVTRRLADTTLARDELGFEAEVDLEEGLTRLVEWWRGERAGAPTQPTRHAGEGGVMEVPFSKPHLARRRGRGGRRGDRVRLGLAGPARARVRGGVRRARRRGRGGRHDELHDRAAAGAATSRASALATR